ncbi:DNA ligase D [Virgibacillus pantothenticus]|uniref:ATP-dependent DNA ligase n=1 Tax=Virgibacillus pantothenticus TaxID=1473 RepID=A0A0L0QSD0_VIRPA|nr:DNA ligase D [Virgibacillus pantothenticus]KNE21484.1 ATP-dependent DNA ligase [Virgibacillus pantothenticus]MED3736937.1 DNA ligase D [Virgibacillus pantothenticus]QTY16090.1 DNA ligase D [Virgibacillus pantothenticus]SIS72324.1 bifunctional non-homologous end joining protein LigD [Virgibacillus pantothenticus]
MHVMKPIPSVDIPRGKEWLYEVKYDGYRCTLQWTKELIQLRSKNNTNLSKQFPEIIQACLQLQEQVESHLPLTMDGELVILNQLYQANFEWVQKRARLQATSSIETASNQRSASFMVFDILQHQGESLLSIDLEKRKEYLQLLFTTYPFSQELIYVPSYKNPDQLWKEIFIHLGEGMIAKRKNSLYKQGNNHQDWYKIKNWRSLSGFLTALDINNDYFQVSVYKHNQIVSIGKCKHGLDSKEMDILRQLFQTKGELKSNTYILPPAICTAIHSLDLYKQELREPAFKQILPHARPEELTWEKLQLDQAMFPTEVEITNLNKVFWSKPGYTKADLLLYIRQIAPYMLTFFKRRALTIIRAPDGIDKEHFFQKHLPTYAPAFMPRHEHKGKHSIVCETLNDLIWLTNHGTVEFHTPFQTIATNTPEEIVFDLDPPSRDRFSLAIKAALNMKYLFDELQLISFVKTSGNKGLQVYIPIPSGSMTYEDTALFTQTIAFTLEGTFPALFTTERFKHKRNDKLYIDYVQHGKGKTIIAPYSPRKTSEGTVAMPLFWNEVTDDLTPQNFTIKNVVELVKERGCPWQSYEAVKKSQNLEEVLTFLQDHHR